jgi:hypothetical protein
MTPMVVPRRLLRVLTEEALLIFRWLQANPSPSYSKQVYNLNEFSSKSSRYMRARLRRFDTVQERVELVESFLEFWMSQNFASLQTNQTNTSQYRRILYTLAYCICMNVCLNKDILTGKRGGGKD